MKTPCICGAWRGPCFFIEKVKRDGLHEPLLVQFGELRAAQKYAMILWRTNIEKEIVGYAVTDGADILFTATDGRSSEQ